MISALRDRTAGRPVYSNLHRNVLDNRGDQKIVKPFGFPMNTATRPKALNQLDKALRERTLPFVTVRLLKELGTFVYRDVGTSPAAQDGAHDDCVMAAAITLEMYRLKGEHPDRKKSKPRDPEPSRPWHGVDRKLRRGRGSRDAVAWNT